MDKKDEESLGEKSQSPGSGILNSAYEICKPLVLGSLSGLSGKNRARGWKHASNFCVRGD